MESSLPAWRWNRLASSPSWSRNRQQNVDILCVNRVRTQENTVLERERERERERGAGRQFLNMIRHEVN